MEISWYFVSFNGVYLTFLEVYKLLLILSQGCKLEPYLYQFSVGPHPPFRVSFWCVCVCAWKGKHACSIASWHPHKIMDVQLYHVHWYVMKSAMIVQMAAVPLRGACKYFQSVADMKKKANVKDIRLSANGLAIWKCRADHGIAAMPMASRGFGEGFLGATSGRIEMIE